MYIFKYVDILLDDIDVVLLSMNDIIVEDVIVEFFNYNFFD